jgi:hypothetical protein
MNEEVPDGSDGTQELPGWWNDWLQMTPEQFSVLLETVRKITEKATSEAPVDMEMLRWSIIDAIQGYRVDSWSETEISKVNIHEIAAPLDLVIAALRNDANGALIHQAIAENGNIRYLSHWLAYSNKPDNFFAAIRRREALLADLERLKACAAQYVPPKRPRHREPWTNLRLFVGHLANGWLVATNSSFTSDWSTKEPVSLGAQFVYEVVKVVDPSSLPKLQTATRWVVHARLRGKLPGYFSDTSRKDAI